MIENIITGLFTLQGLSKLIIIGVLVLEVIYLMFSFLLTREVHIMNRSFKSPAGFIFRFLSYVNLIAAMGVILISLSLL